MSICGTERTVTLVSLFTVPNPILLQRSSGTLIACGYDGNSALVVVDVTVFVSVIAMVPFTRDDRMMENPNQFYIVEKLGLDFATGEDPVDAE
jgi:hypothetical protein